MSKKNPFIALLTDFGTMDAYVGTMKGVIYSIHPSARVIDVTHDVSPQQIDQAAFMLWSSYKYFPAGTIFVCVVDPGVGSPRKILCVQTDKYTFLAPDNGVLKFVLSEAHIKSVYDVTKPKIFSHPICSTFHGRDIFAPIAANLAKGEKPALFGRATKLTTPIELLVSVHSCKAARYKGRIIHIDRFGNAISNFLLPDSDLSKFVCNVDKNTIERQVHYYAEAETGEPFILRGSSNLLEISMQNDHAASALKLTLGQEIILEMIDDE